MVKNVDRAEAGITVAVLLRSRRLPNLLAQGVTRQDQLLPHLTVFAFRDKAGFVKLCSQAKIELARPKSELMWALKGYLFYLQEEYRLAGRCFVEAVILNPENYDNWMDLAFSLRHCGQYQASQYLIFSAPRLIESMIKYKSEDRRRCLMGYLRNPR